MQVLEDPRVTSVRLVTNAEKMVVRETQRAFVYFSLHGLTVDQVLVNRVLPADVADPFFREWRRTQEKFLKEIEAYFAPVPMRCVPLFRHEVLGLAAHPRPGARNVPRPRGSGRGDAHRAALFLRANETGATRCGCRRPLPSRVRLGCSRKARNWSSRWARCGGTSGCRLRWAACRRSEHGWRTERWWSNCRRQHE